MIHFDQLFLGYMRLVVSWIPGKFDLQTDGVLAVRVICMRQCAEQREKDEQSVWCVAKSKINIVFFLQLSPYSHDQMLN